jgi:hypothetical protein
MPSRQTPDNSAENSIYKIEKKFYDGKIKYAEAIELFRKTYSGMSEAERQKREAMAILYEAMKAHDEANSQFFKMNTELDNSTENDLLSVSREETDKFSSSYADMESLAASEEKAIALYKKSIPTVEPTEFMEDDDLEILKILFLDLKYRQAERIGDDAVRTKSLDELKKEYEKVIANINNQGKKAEAIIILEINKWLRAKKLDHVINISHSLLREDRSRNIDCILIHGESCLNISLKSMSGSNDVADFNKTLTQKEVKKTQGTNIFILRLDSKDVADTFLLGKRDDLQGGNKTRYGKLINSFARQIISGLAINFDKIRKPAKKADDSMLSVAEIKRKCSGVKNLLTLGYLKDEDKANYNAINSATKKFWQDLNDRKKSQTLREKITQIISK